MSRRTIENAPPSRVSVHAEGSDFLVGEAEQSSTRKPVFSMSTSPRTVLVADDDGNDVLVLRHAFRKAGLLHRIVHVRNGQEAMNSLTAVGAAELCTPDLIVLDLKMPLVDGFDVLAWLRAIFSGSEVQRSRVPVVVLSGSALTIDKQKAEDLGALDYVVKPGDLENWVELAKGLNERWLRSGKAS